MDRLIRARLTLGVLIVVLFPGLIRADWIRLKDGAQIHGRIILKTDRKITLESMNGMVTFDLRKVEEIHLTAPLPKTEDQKRREREAEQSLRGDPLTELRIEAKEQKLGDCRLALPLGFRLKQGRTTFEGYQGILHGIYEEKDTSAMVSLTSDVELPMEAANLEELEKAIRQHLRQLPTARIVGVRQTRIQGKPALVAEYTQNRNDVVHHMMQAWVRDQKCFSLSIAIPDSHFRADRDRYRKILKSFRRIR